MENKFSLYRYIRKLLNGSECSDDDGLPNEQDDEVLVRDDEEPNLFDYWAGERP